MISENEDVVSACLVIVCLNKSVKEHLTKANQSGIWPCKLSKNALFAFFLRMNNMLLKKDMETLLKCESCFITDQKRITPDYYKLNERGQ